MDFFQHQDAARRRTAWLVAMFAMAVVAIILAVYLAIVVLADLARAPQQYGASAPTDWQRFWHPELFLWVSLGTTGVITLGSLYKIAELSGGGETVALLLGGRLVPRQTDDLAEQRLLNVVEEMALASGIPVPPVYVLDHERGINAFAAGHRPEDAVVAVSRGCLTYLTRDELQGVVAHEFSHILNGDMRLNIRLVGILNGILFLAILGYYLMRIGGSISSGSRDKKGSGLPLVLLGLAVLVIGYIGVFFGQLIKSGISRQREYLADASAVQFTRYPAGIAGALKKIGGLQEGSRIRDQHAEEISHMFFADAFAGRFLNLFATHPPLMERIRRLEPTFDGRFSVVRPVDPRAEADPAAQARRQELLSAIRKTRKSATQAAGPIPLEPVGVLERIGSPGIAEIIFAGAMLAEMPPPLLTAAREPYAARALVCALLLEQEPPLRERQERIVRQLLGEPCHQTLRQLAPLAAQLAEGARLPLVEMCLPALKGLAASQYRPFRECLEALITADAKVKLFEYTVRAMVLRTLDIHFGLARPPVPRYAALTPLLEPIRIVLSTLSWAEATDPAQARGTFAAAGAELETELSLAAPAECSLAAFDKALEVLAQASPPLKKRFLSAAAACVIHDGKVTVREGELLRAICATLGCPLPPLVPGSLRNAS